LRIFGSDTIVSQIILRLTSRSSKPLNLLLSATRPISSTTLSWYPDRVIAFAEVIGRENVTAGTDCGLGGRVHPQIAWAKLRAVRDGGVIARKKLWS
jgi:hypothetical protein